MWSLKSLRRAGGRVSKRGNDAYLLVELPDVEVGLVLRLNDDGVLFDVLRGHLKFANTAENLRERARGSARERACHDEQACSPPTELTMKGRLTMNSRYLVYFVVEGGGEEEVVVCG